MLTQLSIHQLRNLQSVDIEAGSCNLFVGNNGSGKTSVLEAIYLLSRGKSFRHHQPKRYIAHHAPHTTVFGRFDDGNSMAVQKARDANTILRLGQQTVYVQSALTKQLPTLLIDPSSMEVLELGSSQRRQLLDWITFHVKQGFHSQWLAYQRLLKQRNSLLKQCVTLSAAQRQELAAWDKGLATHAELITHYRRQVFEAWQPWFYQLLGQLLPHYAAFIKLKFVAGYDTQTPLNQLLQQRLTQDCQMGYTRIGCHRADVQVLWIDNDDARQQALQTTTQRSQSAKMQQQPHPNQSYTYTEYHPEQETLYLAAASEEKVATATQKQTTASIQASTHGQEVIREQAANVLSRGEKKLLITALRLSQLPLLTDGHQLSSDHLATNLATNRTTDLATSSRQDGSTLPVVLLDDVSAELDDSALTVLLQTLSQLSCQVFMTSLDPNVMAKITPYWSDTRAFLLNQGNVQSIDNH